MVLRGVASTGSRWSVRRRTVAIGVLGAFALVLVFVQVDGRAGADGDLCGPLAAAAAARAAADTGSGPRVVVIGDSWSVGLGLDRAAGSWPSRLPGAVHVAGFSGSGFSAGASPCPGVSFADRAPAAVRGAADLVVVEGGLNDYDQPDAEIRRGFTRLMRLLGDRPVVVVGPASAPSRVDRVPHLDAVLTALTGQYGVAYVDPSRLDLPYLDDRLHLTAVGHTMFGDYVAQQIAGLVAGLAA